MHNIIEQNGELHAMKQKREKSNSIIHKKVENEVFALVKEWLQDDTLVANPVLPLGTDGECICPDFYSEKTYRIGEIHSHTGKIKGAQWGKITKDILKMLLFEELSQTTFEKYLIVCSKEEEEQLLGSAFVALAIRTYGIHLKYIEIPESRRMELIEAQVKENLLQG